VPVFTTSKLGCGNCGHVVAKRPSRALASVVGLEKCPSLEPVRRPHTTGAVARFEGTKAKPPVASWPAALLSLWAIARTPISLRLNELFN
jgi:hypothetical protein